MTYRPPFDGDRENSIGELSISKWLKISFAISASAALLVFFLAAAASALFEYNYSSDGQPLTLAEIAVDALKAMLWLFILNMFAAVLAFAIVNLLSRRK